MAAELTDLADGAQQTMAARYLVGCDGGDSMIRASLGIGLEGTAVLGRPLHMFFRTPNLFGQLGLRPGCLALGSGRGSRTESARRPW